jgi:probable HAF family extracellular repeat protein
MVGGGFMKAKVGILFLVFCLMAVLPSAGPGQAQANLIDLGSLGGGYSMALDINNRGQVVGTSTTPDGRGHAFLWEKGQMTALDLPEGVYTSARYISDSGIIAGTITYSFVGSIQHTFVWEQGQVTILDTLGGGYSAPTGINNRGQVIGVSRTLEGAGHAFIWQAGELISLEIPGMRSTRANAITPSGQVLVVGWNELHESRAFIWKDGQFTDLGTLGGCCTMALAMNDSGQVSGTSTNAAGEWRLFTWRNGRMTDLGPLPTPNFSVPALNNAGVIAVNISMEEGPQGFRWERGSLQRLEDPYGIEVYTHAINNRGDIIGSIQIRLETGETHAAVWDRQGRLTVLGTLGGLQSETTAINARGQVVGYSATLDGQLRGFLWEGK